MNAIKTVALVGLGAVGASYLAKISKNAPMENIRVVAVGARAERIRSGVMVNGEKYFFPVYEPSQSAAPADLAIFAVKHHHLAKAVDDAKNQIGDETIIMSFLNGITSEETIAEAYGADNVLYSIVMGIDATREGADTAYSRLGVVQFGEAANVEGNYSRNVALVKDFFEKTGVPCEIPGDMKWTLWKKFMINVGANQTSAILRCPYGVLQSSEEARDIARRAMEEVVSLAPYEGLILTDDDVLDAFARIDALSPEGRTSMCQDVEAKRKTEIELFGATVVELGRRHGVGVPVNELMCKMIRAIESSYQCFPNVLI
jgi:2-dehydropantoate 2-reductase